MLRCIMNSLALRTRGNQSRYLPLYRSQPLPFHINLLLHLDSQHCPSLVVFPLRDVTHALHSETVTLEWLTALKSIWWITIPIALTHMCSKTWVAPCVKRLELLMLWPSPAFTRIHFISVFLRCWSRRTQRPLDSWLEPLHSTYSMRSIMSRWSFSVLMALCSLSILSIGLQLFYAASVCLNQCPDRRPVAQLLFAIRP